MSRYYYECTVCSCLVETSEKWDVATSTDMAQDHLDNAYTTFRHYCKECCSSTSRKLSSVADDLEKLSLATQNMTEDYKEIECVIMCTRSFVELLHTYYSTITKCYKHGIEDLIL